MRQGDAATPGVTSDPGTGVGAPYGWYQPVQRGEETTPLQLKQFEARQSLWLQKKESMRTSARLLGCNIHSRGRLMQGPAGAIGRRMSCMSCSISCKASTNGKQGVLIKLHNPSTQGLPYNLNL